MLPATERCSSPSSRERWPRPAQGDGRRRWELVGEREGGSRQRGKAAGRTRCKTSQHAATALTQRQKGHAVSWTFCHCFGQLSLEGRHGAAAAAAAATPADGGCLLVQSSSGGGGSCATGRRTHHGVHRRQPALPILLVGGSGRGWSRRRCRSRSSAVGCLRRRRWRRHRCCSGSGAASPHPCCGILQVLQLRGVGHGPCDVRPAVCEKSLAGGRRTLLPS